MNNSFFSPEQASDPFYNRVRDDSEKQDARSFVEEMWELYEPYAEPEFREKSMEDFHARTWEMYLGYVLLKHGLELKKKKKVEGPDICVCLDDNRRLWIEATAPESGEGSNAVPEYKFGEVSDTPVDKVILRLTGAISEKYDKYNDYRKKSIIEPDDYFVIAINGGRIRYSLGEPGNIPFIVKAVLPYGNWVATIDKISGKIIDSQYEYRGEIQKANESRVPTNIFNGESHNGLSAVLYSCMNIITHRNPIGSEFVCVHNPHAKNKLELGTFRFGRECSVEGQHINIKYHDTA